MEQQQEFIFEENEVKDFKIGDDINDLLAKNISAPVPLINGMFNTGEAYLYCAYAGEGKTHFAQYITACLATNSKCFDNEVKTNTNILYIDGELSTYQIQRRFKDILKGFNLPTINKGKFNLIHKRSLDGTMPDLSFKESFKKISAACESAELIIFDNLSALCREADEIKQNDWNDFNDWLDEMREANKAVIVLHHTDKKRENFRGHSEIGRAVDEILIAIKDDKQSNKNITIVDVYERKNRNSGSDKKWLSFEYRTDTSSGGLVFQKRN